MPRSSQGRDVGEPGLPDLHEQLAETARRIARELISDHPDEGVIADLDARREVLLERIRRITPAREDEYSLLR